MQKYLTSASAMIKEAYRPNTVKSHSYAVNIFTQVAWETEQNPFAPSKELATAFVVHLAQRYKTFATVNTVYSSLVATLKRARIDTTPFMQTEMAQLIRSLTNNMRKAATKRPPVSTCTLRRIIQYFRTIPKYGNALATSILFLFNTGQRQSNVFPPSVKHFDHTRKFTRRDIKWRSDHYKIDIKWEKARQQAGHRTHRIPKSIDPDVCSYSSLWHMYTNNPNKSKNSPLICFDDGNPIPLPFIVTKWKQAMHHLGLAQQKFTLHSLRRGNAKYLALMGLKDDQIAGHVGWRSKNGMSAYIPPQEKRTAYGALKQV